MTNAEPPGRPGPRRPGRATPGARVVRRVPQPTRRRRMRELWRWAAGVAAAVVATVLTAWLVAWGVVPTNPPEGRRSPKPPPASPETASPGSASASAGGEEPFTVAVQAGHPAWMGWITARATADVPPRPAYDQDWTPWVTRAGAVAAHRRTVFFTVQGTSAAQVVLTGLRVRVVQRRPAVRGPIFRAAGGDPIAYRWVAADLDREPPALDAIVDDSFEESVPEHERKPIRFPYEVSLSDAETFAVSASTSRCDCAWIIELTWASQGRTGTRVIDDGGQPFRVSGTANATLACAVFPPQGEGKPGKEECAPPT